MASEVLSVDIEEFSLTKVTEPTDTIAGERLELGRKCFELKQAGKTHEQVGEELGISRSTVIRRRDEYIAIYRDRIAGTPRLHLLAEELAKLDDIEQQARVKDDLKLALQAIRWRQDLKLSTGILPKEPDKLVTACVPIEAVESKLENERTAAEIMVDVKALLSKGTRL